ncbi:hypothetical protein ABBQ38_009250 [Trebouxia sp. C0009 RCD-2024]
MSTTTQQEELYLAAVTERFRNAPASAARSLADSLSNQQRAILLEALGSKAASAPRDYLDKLFQEVDTSAPLQQLDKEEFAKALKLDRQLTAAATASSTEPPTLAMCSSVALAAALPFVGFGFLDNFIMLVAGEEIDATLGVKLGFSTLASAGLGNLVSDVAGIGFADQLEAFVRKLSWAKSRPLSPAQRVMLKARVAKTTGSVLGVTVGCLLGMCPLLWMDSPRRETHDQPE